MLDEIIATHISAVPASNQPPFDTSIDYDALLTRRNSIIEEWRNLEPANREKYKNQATFEREKESPNLRDQDLIPAKNLSLIRHEIQERINSRNPLELLPLEQLDFDDALLELAESLENTTELRELYKLRKKTTGSTKNAGISTEEAARIKNCLSQGRELFLAGRQGSLMVKPLNFFYALTAYSYGIIVLNNPIRYAKSNLPGSHGMSYLPNVVQAQFGGNTATGTFSDLVTAFPTQLVKNLNIEMNIQCAESLIELYRIRHSVGLGTLLSMIPEMTEYYKLTTGQRSRCHPLDINNANDPRSMTWDFHIGDGETRPTMESINKAFPNFSKGDRFGKIVITVPASNVSSIKACIYTDMHGKLWYIDNPFYPVILPEIAVHFLINSVFSNVMRYRPEEWGDVVLNKVASNISLITRHYFSSFQRKFLLVVLRSLSRYLPYAV